MNTDDNLITDNINLAYDLAYKYYKKFGGTIELEELQSLCFLGITKAGKTYNSELQNAFSTYAYHCMKNEIIHYITNNTKRNNDISIFTKIADDYEIQDILHDNYDIITDIENKINIELLYEYIDELPERFNKIMNYYLQGYTMQAIGKLLGLSQPQISKDYRKALNLLRYKFKNWR